MPGKKRIRKPKHRQSLHEQIEDPETYGVRVRCLQPSQMSFIWACGSSPAAAELYATYISHLSGVII